MAWLLASLALGGSVYYGLAIVAAQRFRKRAPRASAAATPSLSFLKPLAGDEPRLADNLRSFLDLDYPDFEVLFVVRDSHDPAAEVARRLIAERPAVRARLVVAGEPLSLDDSPNAKVHNLIAAAREASGAVFVISDSDIRAERDLAQGIAREFADPRLGVLTCPYRAVGEGPWSESEALGMNTEFWAGVLVAAMLAPMDFAVGPTMAIRRECLEAVGGFEETREYLAEDFVLGRRARRAGWDVALSTRIVEHRIGRQGLAENLKHRARWQRSTRRSRPLGYAGQVFTYPLPFALALVALHPAWATALLLAACAALRVAAAWAVSNALGACWNWRRRLLLPAQDLASFAVWAAAFFGNRISWRGRNFHLDREGKLRPLGV